MSVPPPSRTRAIIVGLEAYAGLGKNWQLPGSAVDAARMRELLNESFHVRLDRITTFLAPLDPAQMKALDARPFTREAFDTFLETEIAHDPHGGLLIVCWSGHGFYSHHDGVLHLISPDASDVQLRSVEFKRMAEMLIGAPFKRFSHQVLIVSTCRAPIDAADPNDIRFSVAPADRQQRVQQCQLFACAEGQTARQTSDEGSLLVRHLHTALSVAAQADSTQWPDFIDMFEKTRDAVIDASAGSQAPAVFAVGWDRGTRPGRQGPVDPPVAETIAKLGWPIERLRLHALRCLDAHATWPPSGSLVDTRHIVQFLDNLPRFRDWPPLVEFVVRVHAACAEENGALVRWLDTYAPQGVRGDIAQRCGDDHLGYVLQIWYEDDSTLLAALFDADNLLLPDVWDLEKTEVPIVDGDFAAAVGEWIEKAHEATGGTLDTPDAPLIVELCVPEALLARNVDRSALNVFGTPVVLNDGYAALLRSVDRLKDHSKLGTLKRLAFTVLLNAGRSKAVIRWAAPAHGRAELLKGVFKAADDSPVWIGLPPPSAGSQVHDRQLRVCLDGPAPAIFWLRPDVTEAERVDVQRDLEPLLRQAGADLVHRLLDWRLEQIGCAGADVALLIDDPRRIPPFTIHYGQPIPTTSKPGASQEP